MLKKLLHFILMGLIALMFVMMIVLLFRPELFEPVIEWIKNLIEHLGKLNYLLAFVSALLESLPLVWSIFPGQVVMLSVGGFYGGQGITQFLWVAFFAIFGSVISNSVWYFLGRYYGEDFFEKYGMWVGIEETELKYLKKWVDTWGAWGIILSKFHAHLRAFLPFIAGSMGLSTKRFWIFNCIGSTVWAFSFILIGIFFAEYYEQILKYFGWIFTGIMIVVLWYFYLFRRDKLVWYFKQKQADIEAKQQRKLAEKKAKKS